MGNDTTHATRNLVTDDSAPKLDVEISQRGMERLMVVYTVALEEGGTPRQRPLAMSQTEWLASLVDLALELPEEQGADVPRRAVTEMMTALLDAHRDGVPGGSLTGRSGIAV